MANHRFCNTLPECSEDVKLSIVLAVSQNSCADHKNGIKSGWYGWMGGWQELGGGGGTEERLHSLIIDVDGHRGRVRVDGRCWRRGGSGVQCKGCTDQ